MKLIMILLVRDEADIIQQNVDFHFKSGVDHVIAIDNGSIDGTRDILADLALALPVTICDEPGRDYAQSDWVNKAISLARDNLHADWIFSNDADEFWIGPGGSIKNELARTDSHMLTVTRRNMIYAYDAPRHDADWSQSLIYRVADPITRPPIEDIHTDILPCPYFYLNLPPKVIFRTDGFREISMGNHMAYFDDEIKHIDAQMVIYHYPARSSVQFERKITQGGAAFQNHKNLRKMTGWHWRRWYRAYQEHGITAPLADALPSKAILEADLQNGIVVEDRRFADMIVAERSGA